MSARPGASDRRTGPGPVLVTIVGDEPLAPLILARQVDARRVICVGQAVVEWRVEPLLDLLRREGRASEWLAFAVADVPTGLAELDARLALDPAEEVVFDLTNARGVLGFAVYELAHRRERRAPSLSHLLRIDWSDRLVRTISPDRAHAEPLQARLGLAEYLEAHGKRLLGVERAPGSPSRFGPAARRIAASLADARPLLTATHQGHPERPLRLHGRHVADRLIDDLIQDGVLERRGHALFATSVRAYQFLHGRWLEEYLFEIADASGRFDDCASGVRFSWSLDGEQDGSGDVANEIDFAGTAGGRATIASCKTGGGDVNGPLYEVLTLSERAAGRSVVTVFATTDTLDQPARRRAAALGIRVLDAPRLADPASVLTTLLNGPTPPTADRTREAPRRHKRPRRRS